MLPEKRDSWIEWSRLPTDEEVADVVLLKDVASALGAHLASGLDGCLGTEGDQIGSCQQF